MTNSKALKESVTDPESQLKFQSPEAVPAEGDIQSEKEKHDAITKNLQSTLGISKEELDGMIDGEHFNHQY